ncbi:hypothetical protein C8A00DRAFT_33335 [Chaetomidium leptoderma]|uniref:Uncharacterized protein n=1 Tax=Chaetomidium leptoderma TaxID=669021 RepID=A0AAN6VM85_9PEZI|nr:hypothetical protein C8A00DRAFT_33335 [Chaetomidium leptoderma]
MPSYDPNGYMQYETIRDYYKQLTKDSLENVVDNLWNNILREYFFNREGFQLEVQSRPAPGLTKQSNDVTVRYVKNGNKKPLILLENKRMSLETHTSTWRDAVTELTNYMKLARSTSSPAAQAEPMFGIVTVGHYSRFYILYPHESTLTDHPTTAGDLVEFKQDESLIVSLLLSIKAQASRPSSAASHRADARPGSRGSTTASRPASRGNTTTASRPASRGTGK